MLFGYTITSTTTGVPPTVASLEFIAVVWLSVYMLKEIVIPLIVKPKTSLDDVVKQITTLTNRCETFFQKAGDYFKNTNDRLSTIEDKVENNAKSLIVIKTRQQNNSE